MHRQPSPAALLDLPPGPDLAVLRAGLLALRVLPEAAPLNRQERNAALLRLATQARAVAFVDISNESSANTATLAELDALLPRDGLRARVFLTRLAGGHVSAADRQWVRHLGFADLLGDFSAMDCEGELRRAIDAVAKALELTSVEAPELARYVRVMDGTRDVSSPRALIRALTGLKAEDLAERLRRSLRIEDRSYRLQTYPACFVGTDAVEWLARHLQRPAAEAVAVGQALMATGLLVHVVQEQPFLNDHLFYRLTLSPAADRLDPGLVLGRLAGAGGVAVGHRDYMARTYADCWIGSEAVDLLCADHGLKRHEAWVLLHRLMQFDLIEHVAHSRPFLDGHYFYRFKGVPPSAPPVARARP